MIKLLEAGKSQTMVLISRGMLYSMVEGERREQASIGGPDESRSPS